MNSPSQNSERPAPESAGEAAAPERWVRTPPIDIFEVEDGLVLRADLPGVTAEGLELQVQDNRLTLFGRVASPAPAESTLIHQEYHEGDFLRSFILSEDVDHERISARINNGVLEVILPRTPRSQPRRIAIQTQ